MLQKPVSWECPTAGAPHSSASRIILPQPAVKRTSKVALAPAPMPNKMSPLFPWLRCYEMTVPIQKVGLRMRKVVPPSQLAEHSALSCQQTEIVQFTSARDEYEGSKGQGHALHSPHLPSLQLSSPQAACLVRLDLQPNYAALQKQPSDICACCTAGAPLCHLGDNLACWIHSSQALTCETRHISSRGTLAPHVRHCLHESFSLLRSAATRAAAGPPLFPGVPDAIRSGTDLDQDFRWGSFGLTKLMNNEGRIRAAVV